MNCEQCPFFKGYDWHDGSPNCGYFGGDANCPYKKVMTKYIDVNKLINQIKDLPTWIEVLGFGWRSAKYPNGVFDCEDVINSIQNQPIADVEEVKHREWIEEQGKSYLVSPIKYDTNGEPILQNYVIYKCSCCGRVEDKLEPYCHCGAKMDGGRAE